MLGQPLRCADPAVAITGAAVLEMKGVEHAVADEPVGAGHIELRVRTVAIERTVQLARQLAFDFQERRVALHRDRREVVQFGDGVGLGHGDLPRSNILTM